MFDPNNPLFIITATIFIVAFIAIGFPPLIWLMETIGEGIDRGWQPVKRLLAAWWDYWLGEEVESESEAMKEGWEGVEDD